MASKTNLLEAKLLEEDTEISSNHFYFTPVKDINLPNPDISITANKTDKGYSLEQSTDVLAKSLYLSMEEEAFFSDNYFDLLPGETKLIDLETEADGDIHSRISIITVRDSYQETKISRAGRWTF